MAKVKPEIVPIETEAVVTNTEPKIETNETQSIAKPNKFSLDKFKSKSSQTIANVGTLPNKLPVLKISDVGDFVRVHHDEENFWTYELCFVDVPIKDQKKTTLRHLINEELALRYLEPRKIKRCRLALAMDALGRPFLCTVPSRNLDNEFNATALKGIKAAQKKWAEVVRREGHDDYMTKFARNPKAFGEPKWPSQSLEELIGITFEGRNIESDDHPGLLRLIGDSQDIS